MSRARCVLTGLLLSVLTAPCLAHEDDPKALDRHPPYLGPGWTRDGGGTYPPFDADNVELMSWLPLSTFGASSANDCWGYVSPSGREYAIIGLSNGTGFVEVTNPGSARVVKFISGPGSLWRGVKVYGSFCYAVSEGGGGIQVIEVDLHDHDIRVLVGLDHRRRQRIAPRLEEVDGTEDGHAVRCAIDLPHRQRVGSCCGSCEQQQGGHRPQGSPVSQEVAHRRALRFSGAGPQRTPARRIRGPVLCRCGYCGGSIQATSVSRRPSACSSSQR